MAQLPSTDSRLDLIRDLKLGPRAAPAGGATRKGKREPKGVVLPRPFGNSPSDTYLVNLIEPPGTASSLAAFLGTLVAVGIDSRLCKGNKQPAYAPTASPSEGDAALLAKFRADVNAHPARRMLIFMRHYADLSRQVSLCSRPYECTTATHDCGLSKARPLFPGFCATCIKEVRGVVMAAMLIHDACMLFHPDRAETYVHVFFRECLRFHWRSRSSSAAYFNTWVAVCARHVLDRLEEPQMDAKEVAKWSAERVLRVDACADTNTELAIALPGHAGRIPGSAPYMTVPCARCADRHRVALPPGASPAPNPPSEERPKRRAPNDASAVTRTGKKTKRSAESSDDSSEPVRASVRNDNDFGYGMDAQEYGFMPSDDAATSFAFPPPLAELPLPEFLDMDSSYGAPSHAYTPHNRLFGAPAPPPAAPNQPMVLPSHVSVPPPAPRLQPTFPGQPAGAPAPPATIAPAPAHAPSEPAKPLDTPARAAACVRTIAIEIVDDDEDEPLL